MKRGLLYLATAVLGAGGGYLYWLKFGCTNGCPLKSSAPLMTVYGAVLGLALVSTIVSWVVQRKEAAAVKPPDVAPPQT